MDYLIRFYVAFMLCTLAMPGAKWLGRRLDIVDRPSARRVHLGVIPRTGGLAMAFAVFVALGMSLQMPRTLVGYLAGAVIIVGFGIWDDMRELGYRVKFGGQIAAVVTFTVISGSGVHCLGELLPGIFVQTGPLAIVFTMIFMLAVINIINLSDGLDSLAGGLSLLILLVCAMLGYMQQDHLPMVLALTVAGALVGFLRFNTHPAEVFMGDTGSQFLGYTIGACLIFLTQCRSIFSPVLPLFLLGTPVLDTAMVMTARLRAGVSLFQPDKRHLHHKLLRAGLSQEQAVVSIYIFHFAIILLGFALRYVHDYLVLIAYLGFIGLVFLARASMKGASLRAKRLYSSVQHIANYVFVWGGRTVRVRYQLSWFVWNSFFVVFALFFFASGVVVQHNFFVIIPCVLSFVVILVASKKKNDPLWDMVIYYIMLCLVLYMNIWNVTGGAAWLKFIDEDIVLKIFYALSILYFGCLVLTPEKKPLSALDIILIAAIVLLLLLPGNSSEMEKLQMMGTKTVLLGLGLNLIYSRINRNREYMLVLAGGVLIEISAFAVLQGLCL